ncbi:PucR family transcriptional regulator ligand-binding domain-containing protein [Clostridium sp. 'deep sea']|uniref:PucR family transcriptional regulator n=1 Tax=Clostridium sp. 'deep sea' TaxID=2779445 RepID=UPI00189675D5|nr:PucR family transcriptional regulator [Clostridium sp. 'deep sea']QOR33714.1 PucR family transcriptional regulator ligand-binding domain-containing protein [Clostridium sp. 'deep sea']
MKVKDVFELNSKMRNIKLLAGKKGLNEEIKDIGVLEVPDGILWSRKNDLIITTGYFIYKKEIELVDVIKILKQKQAVGLGIKTDRFLKSIPKEAIELANKLNFPFFEIPIFLGYNDFIWPIISNILGGEDYINYRLMKYNEDILKVSKKNYYLKNIVELLSKHLNESFIVVSELKHQVLANYNHNYEINTKAIINQIIKHNSKIIDNNDYFLTKINNKQTYIFPLKTIVANLGYLCIVLNDKLISDLELKIINRTVPYLTISMVNDVCKPKKQYETVESFIKDLLINNKLAQSKLMEQAEYFNINIKQKRYLWALKLTHKTNLVKNIADIAKYLKEKLPHNYIITNSSMIICIENNIHLHKENKIICDLIYKDLNSLYSNCDFIMAISEQFNNLSSIADAYDEAMFCIEYATKIDKNAVYEFKNLIVDNLLNELKDNKHLNKAFVEIVVKLKHYDTKNKCEYFNTLVQFINSDYNVLKTSQNLFIHRNTLYKRLKKIEEILNIKLNNQNTKILLYLCLKFANVKEY